MLALTEADTDWFIKEEDVGLQSLALMIKLNRGLANLVIPREWVDLGVVD